jgi:NCAIR mutase (PurE)-related protein
VNADQIKELLRAVASQQMNVDEAVAQLRRMPFESLPFATVDHHRSLRCGHPEVIFCQGKTPQQVVEIAKRLGGSVLATRADEQQIGALCEAFGNVLVSDRGRVVLIDPPAEVEGSPHVALISAGTSDLPVVEEAAMTLRSMSVATKRLHDVGVAGLHRLLGQLEILQDACAVIVVAGPVFAVPTSVGYGASFGGLAALLGMLNSCSSNVSVVNIDNGFGAAYSAGLVYQQIKRHACKS